MPKLTHSLVLALTLPAIPTSLAVPPDKAGKAHLAGKMVGKDFLSETDYARGRGHSPRGVSQLA